MLRVVPDIAEELVEVAEVVGVYERGQDVQKQDGALVLLQEPLPADVYLVYHGRLERSGCGDVRHPGIVDLVRKGKAVPGRLYRIAGDVEPRLAGEGVWKTSFFGKNCTIHMRERHVWDHPDRKVGVTVEIVLLNYVLKAQEFLLSGQLKSFREFEGVEAY